MKNQKECLEKIGHGRYGITLNGYCLSRSHEEFNNVCKSFDINFGDWIYMEYDPLERKLTFQQNENGVRFETPIIPPP